MSGDKPSTAYNASTTTRTGFMEFKPRDMATQAKYDAVSPTWQGIESTNAAIARGDYSLDSAEATRQELRAQYAPKPREQPVSVPETKAPSFFEEVRSTFGDCVVQ
jgi:hypothetical protein